MSVQYVRWSLSTICDILTYETHRKGDRCVLAALVLLLTGLVGVLSTSSVNQMSSSTGSNPNMAEVGQSYNLTTLISSGKVNINSTSFKEFNHWYLSGADQNSQYPGGIELEAQENLLMAEFCLWYVNNGFEIATISNSTFVLLFGEFEHSSQVLTSQLNELSDLESSTSATNNSRILPQPSSDLNISGDPWIAYEVDPIKLLWVTVGYNYYYYAEFEGTNALYAYEGVGKELRTEGLAVDFAIGCAAALYASFLLGVFSLEAASEGVELVYAAYGSTMSELTVVQSEENALTNAYNSDPSTLWLAFREDVFLDGVSDAFTVYAYNWSDSHWATVFGSFPELPGADLITHFDSMVLNGQNMYGKDNWIWVDETLSPP